MQTTVQIPGIHCEGCAKLIQDVSAEYPQIKNVDVGMDSKKITLDHSNDFDLTKWIVEVESLGNAYKVYRAS